MIVPREGRVRVIASVVDCLLFLLAIGVVSMKRGTYTKDQE